MPPTIARNALSTTSTIARLGFLIARALPSSNPDSRFSKRAPYPHALEEGEPLTSADFWFNVAVAFFLVVAGGVFAGLTLALMGQDEIYLQVIEQSGEPREKLDARKVLKLLKRGKHWVLVTLLLSNVITNETLPIVLDRSLGGGWPAVVASTTLIVIFGEVIPQSICVRYGLGIGSKLSPLVLTLMYIMYPIAYPIALLLDYLLGEDHGTVYKKAGLKTLVTLHKTLGHSPSDRLNQDEVTIITAVLDLKDKPVEAIMTPISDVFTMSADAILDEETTDAIMRAGYSRIPIHAVGEPTNFIGMLLVKILITYDPEDAWKVSDFNLATLPETAPDTSCLDIVNFFQEGKSHMVLVSEHPGENFGALGVVTLEDVIEELIGDSREIVDESDVFIDVHKAIRRLNPSPLFRRSISAARPMVDDLAQRASDAGKIAGINPSEAEVTITAAKNGKEARVGAAHQHSQSLDLLKFGNEITPEMMQHFKHLGPSNAAANPRKTTSKTVKIKGVGPHPPGPSNNSQSNNSQHLSPYDGNNEHNTVYGAVDGNGPPANRDGSISPMPEYHNDPFDAFVKPNSRPNSTTPGNRSGASSSSSSRQFLTVDTYTPGGSKRVARSGSLVENVRQSASGYTKTVIELSSSESASEEEGGPSIRKKKTRGKRSGTVTKRSGVEGKPLLGTSPKED
ncbi:DUF21-domain-containing protein [Ascobolus immersus RN42]|uniref:DUF21-domain-containing protein n=1 Tax=Ascobolus immersus RN42 TaxID=1160509 RepID=A0A3N4IF67_ASCIM|nr:DUF21-domain-containing protein [Ascobolus immersus RN42]